jgi:hypothetical protein
MPGVEGRTRTGTGVSPKDFKSFASTISPPRQIKDVLKYYQKNHYSTNQNYLNLNLEAAPGFEPGIKVLQTHALPLGYAAFNLI